MRCREGADVTLAENNQMCVCVVEDNGWREGETGSDARISETLGAEHAYFSPPQTLTTPKMTLNRPTHTTCKEQTDVLEDSFSRSRTSDSLDMLARPLDVQ